MPTKVSNSTKMSVTFYTDDMSDSVTIPAGCSVTIADHFKAESKPGVYVERSAPLKIQVSPENTVEDNIISEKDGTEE